MINFLVTWLLAACSLVVTAYVVPGMSVATFADALVAAAVLGLANAVVRPLLVILTLPLTILTLGLFLFFINAITLQIVGALSPGFVVGNIFSALLGSIVLSFVSTTVNKFVQPNAETRVDS
jgi:putative membrane protein